MMKKLLLFLFLLAGLGLLQQDAIAQVPIAGAIQTLGPADIYPTHLDELQKGGYRAVARKTERDSISNLRRKVGMVVYVEEVDSVYIFKGAIPDNPNDRRNVPDADWFPFNTGSRVIITGIKDFIPRFESPTSLISGSIRDNGKRITANAQDGFVVTGTYDTGNIPFNTGPGTRMMWYPGKAAFRAGEVNASQWDDDNIGDYSIAMGKNTTASGQSAMAIGESNTASGDYSMATGFGNKSIGNYSSAMGYFTTSNGLASTSLGQLNIANGTASTALGQLNIADGAFSTAMGDHTISKAYASLAIGRYNTGLNSLGNDPSITSWQPIDPVFEIGIGSNSTTLAANAFTVFKNGNSIIGNAISNNTTITGTLTIKGGIPLAGKILTSVGTSGLASWETLGSGLISIPDGQILIGNSSGKGIARSITGSDITLSNTGLATIKDDAVTTAKIKDGNVTLNKLSSMPKGLLGSQGVFGDSPVKQIAIGSGLGLTTAGSTTTLSVDGSPPTDLAIGDSYGGGVVFALSPDAKHGLIVSNKDQNSSGSTSWDNAQDRISTPSNHDGAGKYYRDWRLPTKYELNELWEKKSQLLLLNLNNLDNVYWTSTRNAANSDEFYTQDLSTFLTTQVEKNKNSSNIKVRAIRSF